MRTGYISAFQVSSTYRTTQQDANSAHAVSAKDRERSAPMPRCRPHFFWNLRQCMRDRACRPPPSRARPLPKSLHPLPLWCQWRLQPGRKLEQQTVARFSNSDQAPAGSHCGAMSVVFIAGHAPVRSLPLLALPTNGKGA